MVQEQGKEIGIFIVVGVGLGRGFLSVAREFESFSDVKGGSTQVSYGLPTGGKEGQRERCGLKDESSQIPYFNHQPLNSHIYVSLGS